MKPRTILLVAGAAGFSTRDVWEGYRHGLSELGIQVVPYATFSLLRMLSHDAVGNDIIGKAHDIRNGIDAVVFVDGLFFRGERRWVPETLRRSGIPTAVIKTDDPYAQIDDVNHLYDHVFTNELASRSANDVYLPTATLPPPETVADTSETSDLVFIGTLFEDRVAMMQHLADHCAARNLKLRLAGNFPTGAARLKRCPAVKLTHQTVRPDEKWRMYAASKIVVNLFRESSDAVSPNPRVFEVTSMGGPALLSGPRRDEVTRTFGDSIYYFDDVNEMKSQVDLAIADVEERRRRVSRAKEITLAGHLYRHRCQTLLSHLGRAAANGPAAATNVAVRQKTHGPGNESRLGWIIGCGRTGSTWLCEMLDAVPGIDGWHEPYFGRLLQHLSSRPEERRRPSAFFFEGYQQAGLQAVRRAFYDVALARYPGWTKQSLVVKEVNTPELFPLIEEIFPAAAMIMLVRDPLDVLDSYIDMRKPGSWNRASDPSPSDAPEHLARHIEGSMTAAADAFDRFPDDRKLQLRYEEMLNDPVGALRACCSLLGNEVNDATLKNISEQFCFDSHEDTGQGAFRRFGEAGIWQRSGNFDDSVSEMANSILGTLRTRLRYNEADCSAEEPQKRMSRSHQAR
tara:strand:- start:47937 stop:49814 length:1878 start_codon:yes stop_codon:yes gene_type:complete